MPETAKITQIGSDNTPVQPEQPQENGKSQLPGESPLWFHRYLLYRDLGHKRSLRAAVAKERETMRLVKEQPAATKSTPQKKVTAKSSKKAVSAPTPETAAPAINVPGSWKNAAKVYRWFERAHAFDAWLIRQMTTMTYAHMGETFANKYKRVQLVNLLIKTTVEQFNALAKKGTSCETYLDFVKQVAALVKQMEGEMSQVTEDEMKAAITAYGYAMQDDIEKAFHGGEKQIELKIY